MTQRSIACLIPVAAALVIVISSGASGRDTGASSRNIASLLHSAEADGSMARATQQKGRYKKQGSNCEWDGNDSGPDQCTPVTKGRFKKTGDRCAWVANDAGPDQCRPAKGRFAKEGKLCVWRPNDSGPDQCNPKQPR